MKVEVKLYSYHDIDLVSLYKTGRVMFPETTRKVLNSYARKEAYRVQLMEPNQKKISKYPENNYRKYYHYHIILNEKYDADAIHLLKCITPGFRNNFIKAVLRQYLCGVFVPEYNINGDTELFDTMSRMFQGKRKEEAIKKTVKRKCSEAKRKQKNTYISAEAESGDEGVSRGHQLHLDRRATDALEQIASQSLPDGKPDRGFQPIDDGSEQALLTSTNDLRIPGRQMPSAGSDKLAPSVGPNNHPNDNDFHPADEKQKKYTGDSSYVKPVNHSQNIQQNSEARSKIDNTSTENADSTESLFDDFDDFLMETTEQY